MKIKNSFLALKYRDFRLLWLGLLVSRIGSEMQVVAVVWHIYLMTNSPLSLGIIGLARFLPVILFSLFGGIAADLFDRKKIMLLSVIFMTVSTIFLTIATFTGIVTPFIIYLVIAINSALSALETPARQAIVPTLVPPKYFLNAVSLNTTLWHTAIVIGPSIAGFAIAYLGVGSVYALNAVSFLAVIGALLLMKVKHEKRIRESAFEFKHLLEGIDFVRKTPIIYSTMILDFIATFFSSATILLPIFARDILSVGPQGIGFLYASASVGAVAASLVVSSLHHLKNQGKILLASVMIYGLSTIAFGLSRSFYLSMVFLALSGAGDIVSTIIRNTIRQLVTPDHLRGRMVAVNMIFFMGGPQLGELEAGITASLWGAPLSVIIGGIGTIAATTLTAVLVPKLRNYQGNEVEVI